MKIQELNRQIKVCYKCQLSETRNHVLCGEGDPDACIMLVAQAPGEREDMEGRMFIGPSGGILEQLLEKNGIRRDGIYMTNLVKCMLPKYRKPKQVEIDTCSYYLEREIEIVKPEVIATLGHYASRHMLQKYVLDVPTGSAFREVYGKLYWTGERKILPLQHPAAVLYNPDMMPVLEGNYHKLQVLWKNCKWYPACPMKRLYEQGRLERRWVELYCKGDWESCVRYKMEEQGEPHSDYMLPDGTILSSQ